MVIEGYHVGKVAIMKRISFLLLVLLFGVLLNGFRMHDKTHLTTLEDDDAFLVEDYSDGNKTKYTTCTELQNYIDAEAAAMGNWGAAVEKTIVSDLVTLDGEGYYKIDTENDVDSDNITQITGLSIGDVVLLRAENDARTVIVRNNSNMLLEDGKNFILNSINDRIKLQCKNVGICVEISRASAGD